MIISLSFSIEVKDVRWPPRSRLRGYGRRPTLTNERNNPMSNEQHKTGWGTICSVLVGLSVAIVPLVWQIQRQGETQKAMENLKAMQAQQEQIQKAHRQLYEQQQQGGNRPDLDLQYPPKLRDPRPASPFEGAARQLAPGGAPINDGTVPHGRPAGSPAVPAWGKPILPK